MPILFATALAFGSMGCTSTCESVCEKGNACSADDENFVCEAKCDASEKKADDLGCDVQYDDYMSCQDDLNDLCDANAVTVNCAQQSALLTTCQG
ncbi:MAG: hypothetical protein VB934_14145 [Polyangiaceae bacterium]